MVLHPLFSPLALIALVWLFVVLLYAWPSDRARRPSPAAPRAPRRKRSPEPKPFAGMTHKPHCALCAQEAMHPTLPSPLPPDPMPLTHRRPWTVDTTADFCPHTTCEYRGWLGRGNLRANGHPRGGPWRQFYCRGCNGYFLETHGTIFHSKRVTVELLVRVLACLAEGLGIRATARVFAVDPNTVLQWLGEAAEQLHAFSRYFLCDVHVKQLQLDELYAVLREVKAGGLNEEEAITCLERSPSWVWTAMDPESKLLLVIDVGTRTLEMAQRVVHQLVQVLAPGCVPLFLTDGFREYLIALLTHYGHWV
jgi:transposase-like protein